VDGLLFSSTTGPKRPERETRVDPRVSRVGRRASANSDAARQRVRQKKAKRLKRDVSDAVKRVPVRTCVGCGTTDQAEEMLRVAFVPAGTDESVASRLLIDIHGKRSFPGGGGRSNVGGRGAWVHARPKCVELACSKGFSRAFKQPLQLEVGQFYSQLHAVAERQLEGLVLAAWRSRRLVYGGDAVKEALNEAPLGIVAADARAVAKESFVQEAARSGKMLIWSTKTQLGSWMGRSEVGVLAVMDGAIAQAMRRAIALSNLAGYKTDGCEPANMGAPVEAFEETLGDDAPREDESSEVR
jgi:predicted RNA-binding protein YlxR (DUF448 family)